MIPPRLQDWHVKSCSDLDGCLSGSGESGKMSGAQQLLQTWSRVHILLSVKWNEH